MHCTAAPEEPVPRLSNSETSIICADIAIKSSGVDLSFVDRFSGTLIFTGLVAQVEQAMEDLTRYCQNTLGCTVCPITKT